MPYKSAKIERAIHCWLDLLANEDYTEAFNFILHDADYEWTPTLIEDYIKGYELPYEEGEAIYKVTNWKIAFADNKKHNKDLALYDHVKNHKISDFKIIGDVHYDLPLNGEWSDLTAVFNILQADKYIILELTSIHVL